MADARASLEERITRFETLLEEMRAETANAHAALRDIRKERREIDRLLSTEVKKMVEEQVSVVIKAELDKLGPGIREQTNLIYAKVGIEIDKLISIALGKEFSVKRGQQDLRPDLARHLRIWIADVIQEETGQYEINDPNNR